MVEMLKIGVKTIAGKESAAESKELKFSKKLVCSFLIINECIFSILPFRSFSLSTGFSDSPVIEFRNYIFKFLSEKIIN